MTEVSSALLDLADLSADPVLHFSGAVSYVATGDVDGDVVVPGVELTFEDRPSRANLRMRSGDVAFARMAATDKAFVVTDQLSGMVFSTGFACLRPRPERCDPRYLKHFLRSHRFHRQKDRLATGATQKAITNSGLARIRIPAPDLDQQRHIADVLDKADAIRRKRKEAIALTEELLRSAFMNKVGPGARDYGDWPVKPIASLAASQPNAMRTGPFGSDLRHSEFVNEGVAVLGIDNAVQNRFAWGERRFITPEKYERLRRYTVRPGDVIVTIMGTTGRSAVVPADIPTAITTKHLATITLDRGQAEPEFVSQALFRHPDVLRQIKSANRGAIMSGLNLGLIKALQLRVPPPKCQREFSQIVRKARLMADRMADQHLEEDLFGSLAAQAFSEAGRKAGSAC